MKRVLVLLLLGVFIVTMAGCAKKSEFDKLMDAKNAIQKKCDTLAADRVHLNKKIADKEKTEKTLQDKLKMADSRIKNLEGQLAKANSRISELERAITR